MIEAKTVVNTNNKEEFINKKTLRRLYSQYLLVFVQHLRRGLEEGPSSRVESAVDSILDCSGLAFELGIITDDEFDDIRIRTVTPAQLIKPLSSIAVDLLGEYLQNL